MPSAEASASRAGALLAWLRTPRGMVVGVYAVALAVFVVTQGMPLERGIQTVWLLLGLFAVNFGRPWRAQGRILLDWLPFVGFLLVYDYSRGVADKLGMPVHVTEPLAAEKWIFHGVVPTQWLQEHFYDPAQIHWWDVVVAVVYTSHFVVVWVVAAVLYVRSRERWAAWARRLLLLSYAGLLTYMLYPAAPPWYAASGGLIPDVDRIASRGLEGLHLHAAAALVQQGQAQSNAVAALPSLHAAFTAMLTVFVWGSLRWLGRTLMVVYTLAMAAALVYGGEHYVFDALLGYVYVAAVAGAATAWEQWRAQRRATEAATGPPDEVLVLPTGEGEDAGRG